MIFDENNTFLIIKGCIYTFLVICFANSMFQPLVSSAKMHLARVRLYEYVILVLSIPATIAISPIIFLIFLTFFMYKKIVEIILKYKHGENFGGFLEGSAVFWTHDSTTKNVINIVLMLNFEGECDELCEKIKNYIKESCFSKARQLPKLSAIRQRYLGYTFLLLNKYNTNECVSVIDSNNNGEIVDQKFLVKIVSDVTNKPLPKDHCSLWEIIVVKKPMVDNRIQKYCVIFRMHHCVGDGLAMIKLFVYCFADKSNYCILKNQEPDKKQIKITIYTYINRFEAILKKTYKSFILFSLHNTVLGIFLLKKKDENILHGKALSGKNNCVWNNDPYKKYLNLIIQIKNKTNAAFSEVVLSAVSAAINEYFQMKSTNIPRIVNVALAVSRCPNGFPKNSFSHEDRSYLNNDSFAGVILPIEINLNKKASLMDRLMAIRKRYAYLKHTHDVETGYWTAKVLSLLPDCLSIMFKQFLYGTFAMSNVPCVPSFTCFGGCQVREVFGFAPNTNTIGLTVTIFTYDGRCQIILLADKVLMSEQEAENILSGIYRYLDDLYDEVCKNL